jgi:serine/threonine protein kinase/tetratricopeptide (TPR) repeat protein
MGPEGSRVEALFHEALARPPSERDAFLATACDEATAREVRQLLHASEDPLWFLDDPLVKSLATRDDGHLPIGTRIGDYEITERLGSGGMGHVYRARHLRLECDHAIKVLRAGGDATADARLLAEARKAARLSHPNICTVYHVGEHEGRAYLIMELVPGVTLQQRLHGGPLPLDAARRYSFQVADALAHAHESGVIHGDLKPANIMVTPQGHVKVLDFGVARRVAGSGTGESTTRETEHSAPLAGTLRYMPPEALRNECVDTRGDVWSLGVVLYEMLTGRSPFRGETAFELSSSILRDAPAPFSSTRPSGIEPVVLRCLEKDVARRYQTAGEVRAALEAPDPGTAPYPTSRRPAWRWAAAALLAVLLSGVGWWFTARSSPSRDRVSIAVLPLESLSGGGDEYFADGVTEVLIGDLAQVRAIRVISRQSTLGYRRTTTPAAEIARTLGVDFLVIGTVTRAGAQVRITAQLLNPFTDEHLWSNSFTRPLEDVLTLQNEVAREIARYVAVTIRPEEERRFAQTRPVRPEVADAYLRGRSLWNVRSKRALEQGADAFRTAIRMDPEHAQSYSGLADTYAVQASLGFVRARDAYELAREAAHSALRLDPGLAEPHASLGRVIFSYEWDDGQAAEQEFLRAVSINPSYPTARQWYAVLLATRGRLDEALNEARLAEQSNPLSPIIHWNVARTHFFRGEHDAALAAIARALELEADFPMALVLAARVHAQQGRVTEAQRALDQIPPEDVTSESLALSAYLAAIRGDGKAAISMVQRLEADPASQYVAPYYVAKVYTALKDPDQAFSHLDRAADERVAQTVFVGVDPEFAPLRGDPRFEPLAKRVGVAGRR